MIIRPHVCSACRIRLLRRTPVFSNSTRHAYLSSRAVSQPAPEEVVDEGDVEPAEPQGGLRPKAVEVDSSSTVASYLEPNGGGVEDGFENKTQTSFKFNRELNAQQRQGISEHPLGKLFGYAGEMQRENRKVLDIDALGRSAEVIILRDSGLKFKRHAPIIPDTTELPAEEVDILAKLDKERGLVGSKQVDENINSFRPRQGEEPQNWVAFNELVQQIQSSFTQAQLASYLQNSAVNATPDLIEPIVSRSRQIKHISPFLPKPSDEAANSERGGPYSPSSYTAKQKLSVRVMRECWGLGLPDLEDGIGELDVFLKNPRDLDLLIADKFGSKHVQSILKDISSKYRSSGGRSIQTSRKHSMIRIIARRDTCERIVEDIEQVLSNIQRREVNLRDLRSECSSVEFNQWVGRHYSAAILEQLATLTQTEIVLSNKKKVYISGIEEDATDASLKTDAAVRLLLSSNDFSDRTISRLGFRHDDQSAGALYQYPLSDSFSWRDKIYNWARWSTPVAKDIKVPAVNDHKLQETVKQAAVAPAAKPAEGHDSLTTTNPEGSTEKLHWSKTPDISSSAIFGNALFSHPSPKMVKDTRWLRENAFNSRLFNAPSIFATKVPNASRVLREGIASLSQADPLQTIKMRFLPNAFHPKHKSGTAGNFGCKSYAFPPIEMNFSVRRYDGVLTLQSIQAILETHNSDLLLSDMNVDLRFQQRVTSTLHIPYFGRPGALPPAIDDFLKASNLSIGEQGKGRLTTPAKLTIPLQAHLCRDPDFEALGIKTRGDQTFDVPYLFAGLEIMGAMLMETENGWQLNYTSVEGGRAGGRRAQLELLAAKRQSGSSKTTYTAGEAENSFIREALKIAGVLDKSHKGVKSIQTDVPKVHWNWPKGVKGGKHHQFFLKQFVVTEQPGQVAEEAELLAETDQDISVLDGDLIGMKDLNPEMEEMEAEFDEEAEYERQRVEERKLVDDLEDFDDDVVDRATPEESLVFDERSLAHGSEREVNNGPTTDSPDAVQIQRQIQMPDEGSPVQEMATEANEGQDSESAAEMQSQMTDVGKVVKEDTT